MTTAIHLKNIKIPFFSETLKIETHNKKYSASAVRLSHQQKNINFNCSEKKKCPRECLYFKRIKKVKFSEYEVGILIT